MTIQSQAVQSVEYLSDNIKAASPTNLSQLNQIIKKSEEEISRIIKDYNLISEDNLPQLLKMVEIANHQAVQKYEKKMSSLFHNTVASSPELDETKSHFENFLQNVAELNKHIRELNNSKTDEEASIQASLKIDLKKLHESHPLFARSIVNGHPHHKRLLGNIWKEAKHENEFEMIKNLKNQILEFSPATPQKVKFDPNIFSEALQKVKSLVLLNKDSQDFEIIEKQYQEILTLYQTFSKLESAVKDDPNLTEVRLKIEEAFTLIDQHRDKLQKMSGKTISVISSQSALFEEVSSKVQALLSKYTIRNSDEKLKLLQELDILRQNIDSDDPSAKKLEDQLGSILLILSTYSSLPKTHDNLDNPSNVAILPFLKATKYIIQQNPIFAYRWLRKIAKTENNSFIATLVADSKRIDFGTAPLHADFVKQIASLSPRLQTLNFGEITGSKIDLSLGSPVIVSKILKKIPLQIKEIILPVHFFKNGESEKMISQGSFPKIKTLFVASDISGSPHSLKPKELGQIILISRNAQELRLPPITIHEHITDPSSGPIISFSDFFHIEEGLVQPFNESLTSIQNSILRALAQGTPKNGDHTLFWLKSTGLSRQLILWILNSVDSKETLKSFEKQLTHDDDYLSGVSGRNFLHLLLSTDKLSNFYSLSSRSRKGLDFSFNPLMTDAALIEFIHAKNSSSISNQETIYNLNLSGNDALSDTALHTLLRDCHHLEKLDLSSCSQITEKAFLNLPKGALLNLRVLNLKNTFVSREMITLLQKEQPQIHVLSDQKAFTHEILQRNRESTGDFILTTIDKKQTRVHKEIIRYEGMIALSERALDALIDFKYTGSLKNFDGEIVLEIIDFSKNLDQDLYNQCLDWLKKTTTPQNVLNRLEIAKQHVLTDYHRFLIQYLDLVCHPDNRVQASHAVTSRVLEEMSVELPESLASPAIPTKIELKNDFRIILQSKKTEISVEVNKFNLISSSTTLLELLKGGSSTLQTEHTEALKKIVSALANQEKLSFQSLKIKEILDLLKECDRFDVAHSLYDQDDIVAWMRIHKDEIDFSDPDWKKLLDWSMQTNQTKIGLRFVMVANQILRINGKLKPHYQDDPFIKDGLEYVIESASFQHFEKIWEEYENTNFLKVLFYETDLITKLTY